MSLSLPTPTPTTSARRSRCWSWGRYWLIVKSTGSIPSWDDATEETWDDEPDGACWAGDGIHVGELQAVRTLARVGALSWTPAGRRPIYLVLYFEGESFPVPTGNWDEWENRPIDQHAFIPLHDTVT